MISGFYGTALKQNTTPVFVPYAILTVLSSVSWTFLVFTPSLVVEMILKDFSLECEKTLIEFKNTCRSLLTKYENLEKALGNFFLFLFSSTQLVLVLNTFLRKVILKNNQNPIIVIWDFDLGLTLILIFITVFLSFSMTTLTMIQNWLHSSPICSRFFWYLQI